MRSSQCFRQIPALLLLASVAIVGSPRPADAQNTADAVRLTVRWVDTRPWEGITLPFFFLAFHNGEVDFFDHDRPLPEFAAAWIPRALGPFADIQADFAQRHPIAVSEWLGNPARPVGMAGPPPPPNTRTLSVDPTRHRFLSFLATVHPTNDAFVGNEDPYQIEVFDSEGRFRGPLYVDVFGNEILDAGLCVNDEARLLGMHVAITQGQLCMPENGTVRPHPGLNGSLRNPAATPVNVLGGSTLYHEPWDDRFIRYDPIDADFSQPGYKLGRLVITRWAATGNRSGSWYSPDHAGEGFSIEVLEPEEGSQRARMLVYWYTFAPDGSGEQVWLMGLGEFDADEGVAADVQMYRTVGGRFASPQNPDLVERQPWGRVRIGFGRCNEGRVFWYPDDPAWPGGDYFIYRLSPEIEGLGWTCRPQDAELVLPGD